MGDGEALTDSWRLVIDVVRGLGYGARRRCCHLTAFRRGHTEFPSSDSRVTLGQQACWNLYIFRRWSERSGDDGSGKRSLTCRMRVER